MFFKLDAPSGHNLYGCSEAGGWMVLTGGTGIASGCGLTGCETGQCQIDSAVIPSYTSPLEPYGVVIGRGSSTIAAIAPGTAGFVLTSNGPLADPSWAPLSSRHNALTGLDFASSGHTGFQAALGFTPERQLNFGGPLQRAGDTISCPTCVTGVPAAGRYAMDFTAQTTVTIAGTTHGLSTADLTLTIFDTSTPRQKVEPDRIRVDAATRDVTVTFAVAQSGRVIVQ